MEYLISNLWLISSYTTSSRFGRRIALEFRYALAQVSLFGVASGFVTDHGHDSCNLVLLPVEQSDRECNRQRSPVFVHSWHPEHVMAVARLPGRHGFSVTSPMTLAQTFGDNEIERIAERLSLRESEEALGSGIP